MTFRISITLIVFVVASVAVAEPRQRLSDKGFAARFGQFHDSSVVGLDYFHRIDRQTPNANLVRDRGIRIDFDLLMNPNGATGESGNFKGETAFRLAGYFAGYNRAFNSAVRAYVGLGIEAIRSEVFWDDKSSIGGTVLYGLEVDSTGSAAAEEKILSVFIEAVAHVGHDRADLLPGKPQLFQGVGVNAGIRSFL